MKNNHRFNLKCKLKKNYYYYRRKTIIFLKKFKNKNFDRQVKYYY